MNRKTLLILMICLFCVASWAGAAEISGQLELGYQGAGSDDSQGKAAEFQALESSAGGELDLTLEDEHFKLETQGRYRNEDESAYRVNMDAARMLRGSYEYQEFIHRTRHDTMFENDPHALAGATNAFPKSIEHQVDTDGDGILDSAASAEYDIYDGVIAANPVPMPMDMNGDGVYDLEGMQTATFNDLDQGRDYMVKRRKHTANAKLQLPFFPNLVAEANYVLEEKNGWKQDTLMTGQCTPCHAVSVGQRIDQETEELSVGATLKARDLTLSYFHTERDFTTGTDRYAHQGMVDNDYWYDEAFKSESGAGPLYNTTFESRELFEGEHAPIGSTPESEKTTDTVKLRYDAPLQTTLYGSYVSSSAQNNDTDLDYDMDTAYFSINNRAIRGLNLKAYIKNYRLDNDDYTTTLEDSANSMDPMMLAMMGAMMAGVTPPDGMSMEMFGAMMQPVGELLANDANDPVILFMNDPSGGMVLPTSFFNYTRTSAMSRDVLETGLDASYLIAPGYTLTGSYSFRSEEREETYFKEYANDFSDSSEAVSDYLTNLSLLRPDEPYLDEDETTYHTFTLGLSARPVNTLSLRAKYRYEQADHPFEYAGGLGFDEDWTTDNAPLLGQSMMQFEPVIDPSTGMLTGVEANWGSGNTPFYQILRSWNRTQDASNQPENSHELKLSGTWRANAWVSVSLNGQFEYADNDEADNKWEHEAIKLGGSLFITPAENLSITLGYDYSDSSTSTRYATPLYVGCFSESMGGWLASRYDGVDYDSETHLLYLSASYAPLEQLTLTADITAMWAKAEAGVPDFGDTVIYSNPITGGTTSDPYTFTLMQSYMDYSGSDAYSRLDYNSLEFALGGSYRFTDALSLSLNGIYRWYDDNEAYLGEDLDGDAYLFNASVAYNF